MAALPSKFRILNVSYSKPYVDIFELTLTACHSSCTSRAVTSVLVGGRNIDTTAIVQYECSRHFILDSEGTTAGIVKLSLCKQLATFANAKDECI